MFRLRTSLGLFSALCACAVSAQPAVGGNEDVNPRDSDVIAAEELVREFRESPVVPREPISASLETPTLEEILANGAESWDETLEECEVEDAIVAEAEEMELRLREMLDRSTELPAQIRDLPSQTREHWSQLTELRAGELRRCCEQSQRVCLQ